MVVDPRTFQGRLGALLRRQNPQGALVLMGQGGCWLKVDWRPAAATYQPSLSKKKYFFRKMKFFRKPQPKGVVAPPCTLPCGQKMRLQSGPKGGPFGGSGVQVGR